MPCTKVTDDDPRAEFCCRARCILHGSITTLHYAKHQLDVIVWSTERRAEMDFDSRFRHACYKEHLAHVPLVRLCMISRVHTLMTSTTMNSTSFKCAQNIRSLILVLQKTSHRLLCRLLNAPSRDHILSLAKQLSSLVAISSDFLRTFSSMPATRILFSGYNFFADQNQKNITKITKLQET